MLFQLLFFGFVSVTLQQSKETRQITACWLLTVRDNADHSRNYERMIQTLTVINKNKTELHHAAQVAMVKKCYQLVDDKQAALVLQSMDDDNVEAPRYREVVKGFDYGKLIQELKRPTEIRNEQLDSIMLMMVQELEAQFGSTIANQIYERNRDPNTYLFGVKSQDFALVSLAFLGFALLVGFLLYRKYFKSTPKPKES